MPGIQEVFDGTDRKSPEHTQIELEHQSSYDRDRDELARLGKKQVLKVCRYDTSGAKFCLHVDAWVLLHYHGNVGGHVGVCHDLASSPLNCSDRYQGSSSRATQSQSRYPQQRKQGHTDGANPVEVQLD
ncbi:MAG: hypothetical protein Q9176_002116 [Flavoplaca citrina]